jgi:citrate lyase beta subunit
VSPPATDATSIAAVARHFAAIERRLFEVLGGWVHEVPEPEVKIALRVASFRHAWHAELWDGLVGGGPAAVAVPLVEAVASAKSTAQRLTGAFAVVVPGLVAAYERQFDAASADVAAGGPAVRILSLALADDRAELAVGRRLLDALGSDDDFAARLRSLGGVEP